MSTKPPKTVSRRDNFTQSVIQILYKRAGGKCCRCSAPTFGPVSNNPTKSVNIGQAAHIAAAAPLGPRYDPTMTPEERSSALNGMWMCSNCHDIIDRDVNEFPAAKLKKMKRDAEKRAKNEMGVASILEPTIPSDQLAAGVSATTIVEIRKSKADILEQNGAIIDQTQGEEFLATVSFINPQVDSYLPEVGQELMSYFDQLVAYCNNPSVILEILRRLKIIADTFHGDWCESEVKQISHMSATVRQGVGKRSRVYQSATALLKDLSRYKAIKEKGLHTIPAEYLRGSSGRDQVDGDSEPPEAKRPCMDGAAGGPPPVTAEDRYLDLMEQLSVCEDAVDIERIEGELIEMGYEPNIC